MGVNHLRRKLLVIILIFSVILSFTAIYNSSNKIVAEGKEPINRIALLGKVINFSKAMCIVRIQGHIAHLCILKSLPQILH